MTATVEPHGQDDDLVLLVLFAHLPESTIVKLKERVSNKSLTLHVANDANSIADGNTLEDTRLRPNIHHWNIHWKNWRKAHDEYIYLATCDGLGNSDLPSWSVKGSEVSTKSDG